jgi:EAL and modified HD-GYP domain-containing signal transduction protein
MLETLEIAVARQPIFDRNDQLVAYELLHRSRASDCSANSAACDAARMSPDTIARSLLGFGLERLTGGKRAFVNGDRTMLLDGSIQVLEPHAVVLEILEDVYCDDEVLAACRSLAGRGYTLALDDFVYDPIYAPLLRHVSIVKIDVLGRSASDLREQLEYVRPFGAHCLAERVENEAMRRECAALGFDLFQGYFFARPRLSAAATFLSSRPTSSACSTCCGIPSARTRSSKRFSRSIFASRIVC